MGKVAFSKLEIRLITNNKLITAKEVDKLSSKITKAASLADDHFPNFDFHNL